MKHEAGYDSNLVLAFLTERGEQRNDGKLAFLNGRRLTESHREMVARWAARDTIPLAKLDQFLMRYDLMLFELEQWAVKHHGVDGFVDLAA